MGIVMALAMPIGMLVFGPLADVVPIEPLLVGAGLVTFVVVGLAVWMPSGRRAIAAARGLEARAAASPATEAGE